MSERELASQNIAFDGEGFMTDFNVWNEEIARLLASEIGIAELSEDHWKVINFCRNSYQEDGQAPSLRLISQKSGVGMKALYQLFPKLPAKKVAYVSGMAKPTGCI